jgi:pimeloyl-ACP methyl ester carboxylesterase
MTAYDRRHAPTVEAEAADARELVTGDTILVGSSYGAVVALEMMRTQAFAGAVLIEPPMAPSDDTNAAPAAFLVELDRIAADRGGPAAGELFLRTVLGEAAWARIPDAFRERSAAKWREIRADCGALLAYRPRYAELRAIRTPASARARSIAPRSTRCSRRSPTRGSRSSPARATCSTPRRRSGSRSC